MVLNTKNYLSRLASVLKVQLNQKSIQDDCVISTIFELVRKSNSNLGPNSTREVAEIHQFIEYTMVYVSPSDNQQNSTIILNELNELLSLKTYLVGNRPTVADLFLYYIIFNIMESLTILEKEKYLNICRWFDNIQQDASVRQSNKLIDFSTNYLATVVPAHH